MIISMATEGYIKWAYHFLKSVSRSNPKQKVCLFLINVSKETKKILKKEFPKVIFQDYDVELIPRTKDNPDGKSFLVTYLKGPLVKQAYEQYKEGIIWIDCTTVIRKQIDTDFEGEDVMLVRRDWEKEKGRKVYAAEIIGFNDQTAIEEFNENCLKHKSEWFADQEAICEITTPNRKNLEFGPYCNFYYDEKAITWSDRGKTGAGTMTQEDVDYTEYKFIKENAKYETGYEKKFKQIFKKRYKVLFFTDEKGWCYSTTVKAIKDNLPNFDITIVNSISNQMQTVKTWKGDLVWARCNSRRTQKLLAIRPDLRPITISTITTGGELLESRIEQNIQSNEGELGIFVQNKNAEILTKHLLKKYSRDQKVWRVRNGVDTERFNKCSKKFVVGFAGRNELKEEDLLKGYTLYFKYPTEILNLETEECSNKEGSKYQHEDMHKFYEKISVLIQMSHSEGHSNTLNEAMSCGVVPITTEVGYHGENCEQGKELLFSTRSTYDVINKLKILKDNPKFLKAMSKNARDWALKHKWQDIAQEYGNIFLEAIEYSQKQIKSPKMDVQAKSPIIPIFGKKTVTFIGEESGINNKYGVFEKNKPVKVSPETAAYISLNYPKLFIIE